MKSRFFRGLAACLAWLAGPCAAAGEPALAISQGHASASVLSVVQQIVGSAYRSIGQEVRYLSYPVRRGLVELNAGKMDADLGRFSPDLERDFLHIRVVRVPVLYLQVSVFARAQDAVLPRVDSWDGLWAYGLRIVSVCGARFMDSRPPKVSFECAGTHEGALKMLQAGRADVLVGTRMTVWETLTHMRPAQAPPPTGAEDIQELAVLSSEALYHYVHERHAAAVPALGQFFAQARKDGQADRLVREAIARIRRHPQGAASSPPTHHGVAP